MFPCPDGTSLSRLDEDEDGWTVHCGGSCGASDPMGPPTFNANDTLTSSGLTLGDDDYLIIKENCPGAPYMQLMSLMFFVSGATNITFNILDENGIELTEPLNVSRDVSFFMSSNFNREVQG